MELKAMRARLALQSSYIEKLEDEQSGFAGAKVDKQAGSVCSGMMT
jgi:hypothetical protein